MKILHSAQDAIKQAIEGGWYPLQGKHGWHQSSKGAIKGWASSIPNEALTLIDPLFWQALGKARGFKPTYSDNSIVTWRYWAQEWFHIKMSNGDETKFWESLP